MTVHSPAAEAPGTSASARLSVERLDHAGEAAGAYVLHAAGRAWAAIEVELGTPVLLADGVRFAAAAGDRSVTAGPDGPRWTAEFLVPAALATAVRIWSVGTSSLSAQPAAGGSSAEQRAQAPGREERRGASEALTRVAPTPEPAPPPSAERLEQALAGLREADRMASALERRVAELAALARRARDADARRGPDIGKVEALRVALDAATADRERLEALLDAARHERDALRAERESP